MPCLRGSLCFVLLFSLGYVHYSYPILSFHTSVLPCFDGIYHCLDSLSSLPHYLSPILQIPNPPTILNPTSNPPSCYTPTISCCCLCCNSCPYLTPLPTVSKNIKPMVLCCWYPCYCWSPLSWVPVQERTGPRGYNPPQRV